jgi:hypothetical protein
MPRVVTTFDLVPDVRRWNLRWPCVAQFPVRAPSRYNAEMANQSYLSVWCKDFPEERILERFGAFLSTVPFSATRPGFTYLVIRAVDMAETPMMEQDLRAVPIDSKSVMELAQDYLHNDSAFEINCYWDLWTFDAAAGKWQLEPQPMQISCNGEDYDNQLWKDQGHFEVNFGFEHFFTGHAGLLGIRQVTRDPAQSLEEARFLEAMAWPENLRKYQDKTQENIRKLLEWVRRIETAIPVARVRLWSEGEENFEARLEEILAAR